MTDRAPADTETSAGPDAGGPDVGGPDAGGPEAGPDPGTNAPGVVVVRIPGPLQPLTDGQGEVELPAGTVAAALETLVIRHPGLRRHLLTDDGDVRDYVNVFLNDDNVRYLSGVTTAVAAGDTLTIVPSIAGG